MRATPVTVRYTLAKAAYGALFVLAVPYALFRLAMALDFLTLPALYAPAAGGLLLLAGAVCMVAGCAALIVRGEGLPMNAFPPKNLVCSGVYALLPHPIYCGFVFSAVGISLVCGSAAGLWIASPLAALGCAALVWGYERPFLLGRHHHTARPWLGLPDEQGLSGRGLAGSDLVVSGLPGRKLTGRKLAVRIGLAASVLLPWLAEFYAVKYLGAPPDAVCLHLPGEITWPVLVWTYPVYASAYLFVPLAFVLADDQGAKRLWRRGWVSMAVMGICYLCLPVISPARLLEASGPLSSLLLMEMRGAAPFTAAFPSFHVVWAILAAAAVSTRGRRWSQAAWVLAAAVSASCVTTGMHALLDIVAGAAVGLLLCRMEALWRALLRGAEDLSNALSSRSFGRWRVFSHAPHSFLAGFLCLFLPVLLLGRDSGPALFLLLLCGMAAAALWGQLLEGASPLQRPFGYFGSVMGVGAAGCVLSLAGVPVWPLFAAVAVAAPWIQAAGRLRCLVQGCCHGKECAHGITVTNPRSRVVGLSGLGGRSIHPTQLYSIIGNLAAGFLLLRLWQLGATAGFVCGAYLIFAGLLRFVEEGYRGEAQTPRYGGLPVYQWLAVAMAVAGCRLLPLARMEVPAPALADWPMALAWGVAAGIVAALAMSVDNPNSARRFGRLSG